MFTPGQGIGREALAALVAERLSQRRIAERLGCSQATVRHWLAAYELKTSPNGRSCGRRDDGTPAETIELDCPEHGLGLFVWVPSRNGWRCRACQSDAVSRLRANRSALLIAEAGGRCECCGYHGCDRALQFHHVDRRTKRFELSRSNLTRSLHVLRVEAAKCALVCANCHAEIEDGLRELPDEITRRAAPQLLRIAA